MNKRFAALCLTVAAALTMVLAACGGAPNGDGNGKSDGPAPRTSCLGDWTLAAIEADGVTVVGDLSAMTGDPDGMALSLQGGGTGTATFGGRSFNLSWEEGEGGAVTLKRAPGEAETTAPDATAADTSTTNASAEKQGASGADARPTDKKTDVQVGATAAKRDVSGASVKAAEKETGGAAASGTGTSGTSATTETAAPDAADAAAESATTTKKNAKTPIGTLLADDGFVAEGGLDNGNLVVNVKGKSFSAKLIFAADDSYSGPMPIDPTALGTISTKDAMVGDWVLSGAFMSGATLHGSAEDLASALGIAESTNLSIKDDGTVVALGQQTTWDIDDHQGAAIVVGGTRIALRSTADGIALDASDLLSSQVIMLFTKKA